MREVGQGTRFDLAVFAVGFAEEDGGRGVAIGHGGHVHAYIISQLIPTIQGNYFRFTCLQNEAENISIHSGQRTSSDYRLELRSSRNSASVHQSVVDATGISRQEYRQASVQLCIVGPTGPHGAPLPPNRQRRARRLNPRNQGFLFLEFTQSLRVLYTGVIAGREKHLKTLTILPGKRRCTALVKKRPPYFGRRLC
jgi:hypothetical protein